MKYVNSNVNFQFLRAIMDSIVGCCTLILATGTIFKLCSKLATFDEEIDKLNQSKDKLTLKQKFVGVVKIVF